MKQYTWKPAPPPCWERRFGSGGAQFLIRYLLSWYHAKPSLTRQKHRTIYPTSLHGSLSTAETSSCLRVGNQWETQLISQQLTVVNEHSKTTQFLYQLYLLLFYCLISLVCLSLCLYCLIFMVLMLLKNILFLHCLTSMVSFSVTNIIFLNNSNKYNHTHSSNNLYENRTTDWRNSKIVFQRFLSFPQ